MPSTHPSIFPLEIRTDFGDSLSFSHGRFSHSKEKLKLSGLNALHTVGDFGNIGFYFFEANGFSIWYSEYDISRPVEFLTRGNFATLELSIPITGNVLSSWDNPVLDLIQGEQFDLSYVPFLKNRTRFNSPGLVRTFDIHYSREYLDRFSGRFSELGKFLEKVDASEPASLTGRKWFLSPSMKRLVFDMVGFNMADQLAGYFYEGSVLLMLTMVLDRIQTGEKAKEQTYSERDKECATEVKNILLSDLSERYSIKELARKTCTSETKLQMAFKYYFGTTIFEYAQTSRLDFAKILLLDTKESIQSIAERCGYPDNSNLTAAFKKRFGSSPETFRSKGK